jgi:uncharacterized membrane protein
MELLELISSIVGGIGIGIVVWGALRGFVEFVYNEFTALIPRSNHAVPFDKIRAIIGRYLLLGLEFLVVSDIIHTIIQPTLIDAVVLLIIVAIRTVLSYVLTKEIALYEASLKKTHESPVR